MSAYDPKRTCSEPPSFEHASGVYELRRFRGLFLYGQQRMIVSSVAGSRACQDIHRLEISSGRRPHVNEGKRHETSSILKAVRVGLAASAVAAPAVAQTSELKWRLTASWPKSLDTLYGGCEYFAK